MDSRQPHRRSTSGRAIARRIAAEPVRHQLEIAKANGDDLYEFRRHRDAQLRAAERRDAAVAAARTRCETTVAQATDAYEKVVAAAMPQQSDALTRMKQRGVSDTDLATWTELPVGELRKLLAGTRRRTADADISGRRTRRTRQRGITDRGTEATSVRAEGEARQPELSVEPVGDLGGPTAVGEQLIQHAPQGELGE